MAKHIYHIPLKDIKNLILINSSKINEVLNNKQVFEYRKSFGKSYYMLEIEKFIEFFKINKDYEYALKTIKYFTSENFMKEIYKLLNLDDLNIAINLRDYFYCLIFILKKEDIELFHKFFHKVFLHFHSSLNNSSKINIDFIDLAKTLAKNRKIKLKESFGEDENESYFKIYCDDILKIDFRGKSIKSLRKKAYKRLCLNLR